MPFVALNSLDLAPYPLHFLFCPQLRENWICPHWGLTVLWNLLASFILVMVPSVSWRVEIQRRPLPWLGDKKPPYCLRHSHPCLTYGTLCFLAKTASTFRHSLCQMNSFANSRNTCGWPSWPAVELIDFIILATNIRSWKHGQGNDSYLHFMYTSWFERRRFAKKNKMATDAERHSWSLNSRKQKFVSSEQFPDILNPGLFWGGGFWRIITT